MTALHFHFDYLSPYAYLAWTQLPALAARYQAQVVPVPTLLAALLNAGGQKGPAEIPAKRTYVFKDALRTARFLGLPLVPPPTHPFNPLLALRVSGLVAGDEQRRLIDGLFAAAWGGAGGVEDPLSVAAIADAAGLDGAALVTAAGTNEAKSHLRAASDDAIARGVFGVPTVRVQDELFWGYDAFGHLERYLAGADTILPEDLQRWAGIGASAKRR